MKRLVLFWILMGACLPLASWAGDGAGPATFLWTASLDPAEAGFRYDDNVFRSVSAAGKLADEIFNLNLGGVVDSRWDIFRGDLGYHFGADEYQLHSTLDNLKHDFDLVLSANPGPFSFYYKKDYFIRNSQDFDFDYIDDQNLAGVIWAPAGPWSYEGRYKNYSREYYDQDPLVRSRDFIDQGALASIQREIDERLSLKLEGDYNNRQFNRTVLLPGGLGFSPTVLQTDETWTVRLKAHLYFESILQDITLEKQRTNSNSYTFSNSVESASWAAVVRPVSPLYLQLLFRFYSKVYDVQPLNNPYLQVGFVDEDSQDLLSAKASWEWSQQWLTSLSISRMRVESTQPGDFYIKNILSVQVRRNF